MANTSSERLRQTFSRRLQIARRNAGLTQEQLAEKVGRSVDMISRLERGTATPSFDTLSLVAAATKVKPAELLAPFEGTAKTDATDLEQIIDLILNTPGSELPRLRAIVAAYASERRRP